MNYLYKMLKDIKREKHEKTYGKPMCHLCEECYRDRSKKHGGMTEYCRKTGDDVGQSHFGLVSPKNCPKRQ